MLLYIRIFAISHTMRYLIWGGIGFQIAIYTTTIAIAIASNIACPSENGTVTGLSICTHAYQIELVQAVLNLATDFYVLVLPIRLVLNLQLSPRRKTGAMILFGTGLL